MCNNYAVTVSWDQYLEAFSAAGLQLRSDLTAPNLEPLDCLWPTDSAPIIRSPSPGRVELVKLRWGFAPPGPGAGPIINYRTENRNFLQGRCLAPADCFFEFTGQRSPKTRWRIDLPSGDWFALAAIWQPATPDFPESFSLLTTSPGPDVAPIHNRQVVLIDRRQWRDWLDPAVPSVELLHPSPAGTLQVRPLPQKPSPQGSLF